MTRVLVFGASVVAGFWDPEGGWVHYLAQDLHRATIEQEKAYQVYNLGVSGHTSRQILSRIENEIESRKEAEIHDLIILVTAGGNDALYNSRKGGSEVPLEEFSSNLEEILEICLKATDEVYFIGDQPISVPDIDEDMLLPKHSVREGDRKSYMETAEEICGENGVCFLSISENVDVEDFRDKLFDGIHPDTEGHREIYEVVKDFMREESSIEVL